MPDIAVGLYCAVVERFGLLVSKRTSAERETQAIVIQQAENLRRWLSALNLGSVKGRQREPESGAVWKVGVPSELPTVGIDNGPADRKTNFQGGGFCGAQGFESPLAMLQCDVTGELGAQWRCGRCGGGRRRLLVI
jgi:hypothetical protein